MRVWDLATGEPVIQPLRELAREVTAVAIAESRGRSLVVVKQPYGPRMGTGSRGPSGDHALRSPTEVTGLAVADVDGVALLVTVSDSVVKIWDLDFGQPAVLPFNGHTDWVTSVALANLAGRQVVVSGSADRTIRAWDLLSGKRALSASISHAAMVTSVAAAEVNGATVIISASGSEVFVSDLSHPAGEFPHPLVHEADVRALALANVKGRKVILSGDDAGNLRLWDMVAGTALGSLSGGYSRGVSALATTNVQGRPVAVSASDRNVDVWDLDSRTRIGRPYSGHADVVTALAVSPVNDQLVVLSAGGRAVHVWDAETAEQVLPPLAGHDERVSSIAVSNVDERPVAVTGSADRLVACGTSPTARRSASHSSATPTRSVQ